MKLTRNILLPSALLIYLAFMAYIGYDGVESGETSLFAYIATIVVSLGVVIALYFVIRRRDKLRREREEDMKKPRT